MQEVLKYFYEYHWAPSMIDKWLKLPFGSARMMIVDDWKEDGAFSARLMRK